MIFELLGRDDVSEILRLEQDSWVDGLQANAEVIEDRLEKGHVTASTAVLFISTLASSNSGDSSRSRTRAH